MSNPTIKRAIIDVFDRMYLGIIPNFNESQKSFLEIHLGKIKKEYIRHVEYADYIQIFEIVMNKILEQISDEDQKAIVKNNIISQEKFFLIETKRIYKSYKIRHPGIDLSHTDEILQNILIDEYLKKIYKSNYISSQIKEFLKQKFQLPVYEDIIELPPPYQEDESDES